MALAAVDTRWRSMLRDTGPSATPRGNGIHYHKGSILGVAVCQGPCVRPASARGCLPPAYSPASEFHKTMMPPPDPETRPASARVLLPHGAFSAAERQKLHARALRNLLRNDPSMACDIMADCNNPTSCKQFLPPTLRPQWQVAREDGLAPKWRVVRGASSRLSAQGASTRKHESKVSDVTTTRADFVAWPARPRPEQAPNQQRHARLVDTSGPFTTATETRDAFSPRTLVVTPRGSGRVAIAKETIFPREYWDGPHRATCASVRAR